MVAAVVISMLLLAVVALAAPRGKAAAPCLAASATIVLSAALALAYAVAAPSESASRIASMAASPAGVARYVRLDGLSAYLFLVMAVVNACASLYAIGYLRRRGPERAGPFAAAFLAFDASMAGALLSNHLALTWVFLEATTLAGAYLVSFERERGSLEATWKYLFICSIGVSLAFVSLILLTLAGKPCPSLFLDELYANASALDPFWLKMALAFAVAGFGTKAGLAPMHAWLPDAHSEAPAPVSAVLSGALLNAALLPLFRILKLTELAGIGRYARILLAATGFLSVLVCAAFALRVRNYKRLLAYSSVENIGIVAIGAGLGGIGALAAMLHAAAHSFSKASLFLTAGTIHERYHTKKSDEVRALGSRDPLAASLWVASFVAISGMPPFPSFLSKFLTVKSFFDAGRWWLAPIFLVLLVAILAGMGRAFLGMVYARGNDASREASPDRALGPLAYAPQLILLALLLAFGLGVSGPVQALVEAAASCL
jgi:hydrogenase-4 component F